MNEGVKLRSERRGKEREGRKGGGKGGVGREEGRNGWLGG